MRASLAGDATAYRTLLCDATGYLRVYFQRRLGGHSGSDAEDLVQETLMAIHVHRATYEPERPFTAWLHAIARYKLIDHLRRRRIRLALPLEAADETAFADDDAEAAMARRDLDRLLDTLPAQPRALLRDVKLEGLSVAEAAQRRGLSESAVKVAIHRALKTLSARLKGQDGRGRDA